MAKQSFEDQIRQIVKARLQPSTEDLIKRKNETEAQYFGEPYAFADSLTDVYNPEDKRRLVEGNRQSLMSQANTYADTLNNRDMSIDKVVDSFSRARREEMEQERQAKEMAMAQEDLNLKRQSLAMQGQTQERENKTFADQVNELVAAGYTPEQARAIAAAQMSGGVDLNAMQSYLNPPKPEQPNAASKSNFSWSGALDKVKNYYSPNNNSGWWNIINKIKR